LCLPNIRAYVPAFDADVEAQVKLLLRIDHPAYFRLGVSELPPGLSAPAYQPWRRLVDGKAGVVAVAGPLVGSIWQQLLSLPGDRRPALWLVSELPPPDPPPEFLDDLEQSNRLLVVEEHVAQGGLGRMLAEWLLTHQAAPRWFKACTAQGYPSGRYGSQKFHRRESGLDPATVLRLIADSGSDRS
jgi:transketolase